MNFLTTKSNAAPAFFFGAHGLVGLTVPFTGCRARRPPSRHPHCRKHPRSTMDLPKPAEDPKPSLVETTNVPGLSAEPGSGKRRRDSDIRWDATWTSDCPFPPEIDGLTLRMYNAGMFDDHFKSWRATGELANPRYRQMTNAATMVSSVSDGKADAVPTSDGAGGNGQSATQDGVWSDGNITVEVQAVCAREECTRVAVYGPYKGAATHCEHHRSFYAVRTTGRPCDAENCRDRCTPGAESNYCDVHAFLGAPILRSFLYPDEPEQEGVFTTPHEMMRMHGPWYSNARNASSRPSLWDATGAASNPANDADADALGNAGFTSVSSLGSTEVFSYTSYMRPHQYNNSSAISSATSIAPPPRVKCMSLADFLEEYRALAANGNDGPKTQEELIAERLMDKALQPPPKKRRTVQSSSLETAEWRASIIGRAMVSTQEERELEQRLKRGRSMDWNK